MSKAAAEIPGRLVPGSGGERKVVVAALLSAAALLFLDIVTKIWVEKHLKGSPPAAVIPDFFQLVYVTNKGAAWGIFNGHATALLAVAVVVTLLAIVFFRKLTEGVVERYFAVSVVLAGVVGNAIDRLWRGEVVDFLDFNFFGHHFPAFNVADCAITCGVALYIISSLFRRNPSAANRRE